MKKRLIATLMATGLAFTILAVTPANADPAPTQLSVDASIRSYHLSSTEDRWTLLWIILGLDADLDV